MLQAVPAPVYLCPYLCLGVVELPDVMRVEALALLPHFCLFEVRSTMLPRCASPVFTLPRNSGPKTCTRLQHLEVEPEAAAELVE